MPDDQETQTHAGLQTFIDPDGPFPGLLVAWWPETVHIEYDHSPILEEVTYGRGKDAGRRIPDQKMSRRHFTITPAVANVFIEDLGSKNGTYVNRKRITGPTKLEQEDVIRAGRVLFVFHRDVRPRLRAGESWSNDVVGRHHAKIIDLELRMAVESGRNLLITGPSGSGKELAARAVGRFARTEMLVQNAARFASEEEAKSSLFGVGKGVFSNVAERAGYIEQAHGKVLFLDEAHMLPLSVQKSLLRVIEDGRLARIGQTGEREVDVRFVLASNEPGPDYGLARDLLARLRVVEIPGLARRRADIPSIFDKLLEDGLAAVGVRGMPIHTVVSSLHHEIMMIDGFERDNVRGLQDLVDRVATRVATGTNPVDAMADAFAERFSSYHRTSLADAADVVSRLTGEIELPQPLTGDERDAIELAYAKLDGNVTAMRDYLRERGFEMSRKRIAKILDAMGLTRLRRGRE